MLSFEIRRSILSTLAFLGRIPYSLRTASEKALSLVPLLRWAGQYSPDAPEFRVALGVPWKTLAHRY